MRSNNERVPNTQKIKKYLYINVKKLIVRRNFFDILYKYTIKFYRNLVKLIDNPMLKMKSSKGKRLISNKCYSIF